MEKLKISFEHYYDDGLKGFYITYEIPVMNSTDSREIIRKIKAMLGEDGRDKFGDFGTEELAVVFGVTQNTITNWVKSGMPIVVKTSKGYRFNKEDVFEWVKSHKTHYIYLIERYEKSIKSQK
jgi:excisionase family DNA binding protein